MPVRAVTVDAPKIGPSARLAVAKSIARAVRGMSASVADLIVGAKWGAIISRYAATLDLLQRSISVVYQASGDKSATSEIF